MGTKVISPLTTTPTELIAIVLRHYLSLGQAFSLWRRPHSDEINLIISEEAPIYLDDFNMDESIPGFVIAPLFNRIRKKVFLKASHRYLFTATEVLKNNEPLTQEEVDYMNEANQETAQLHYHTSSSPSSSFNEYTELVNKSIKKIEEGLFEKVVPTRAKLIELPDSFDEVKLFLKLIKKYPHALVSLVSSKETGTWIGATPELLVSTDRNLHFKTVALAGTQKYSPDTDVRSVAWTQKTLKNKHWFADTSSAVSKKIRLRDYVETGPKTVMAGNVLHLKTEFDVDMIATGFPQLGSIMLKLLHPTSAVCGMPLQNAMDFLLQEEGYDREFYSGYLGPVNIDNETHIYVNLRCMQILKDMQAKLYAGAGVTIESIAEKEWEETEIKMNTLLNVING